MENPKGKKQEKEVRLIRILAKDIRGDKDIYSGLTLIKGVSWAFSNAVCKKMKLDKNKKIGDLSEEEIKEITDFMQDPNLPKFVLNRKKDPYSGEDTHLITADLDLQKEFDIKKMKKIKSYKGIRHGLRLPVRGQRTKSNFRKNKKKGGAVGVSKKSKK